MGDERRRAREREARRGDPIDVAASAREECRARGLVTVYVVTLGAHYESSDVVRVASTFSGAKREGETYARARLMLDPEESFDWKERPGDFGPVWACEIRANYTLAVETHEVVP